jgi:hypothetical protein
MSMTNIINYKKFVIKFLWMYPVDKNEKMPMVITKSTFHTKNVSEKEGGKVWKFHMLFNTLYGLHQQLPQT